MDDLNKLLASTLSKTRDTIHISTQKQKKLSHISSKTKHTVCGKKILIYECCILICIIILLCPVSILACSHAVQIMQDKVSDTNLDVSQTEELYSSLIEDLGYTDEEIENFIPLRTNENGLIYGIDVLNADLILVESDQGDDGYVYREDFYYWETYMDDFQSPEDAIRWQEEWNEKYPDGYSVPVYESDGETQIGTFTFR